MQMLYLFSLVSMFAQSEWVWSVHPEAGFKVLTPFVLEHKVADVPTATGVIQLHQYHGGSISDSSLSLAFVIDHYLVPGEEESMDEEYLKEFFGSTVDQILTSLHGNLVYMDIHSQSNQDQCTWKGTYRDGEGIIRGICVLADNKYYGLQVFGTKEDDTEIPMNRFLESFKLIPITPHE